VREAVLVALVVCVADGVREVVEVAVPDGVSVADTESVEEGVRETLPLETTDSVGLGVAVKVVVAVPVGVAVDEMEGVEVDEAEPLLVSEPLAEGVTEGVGDAEEEGEGPAATDAEKVATQSVLPAAGKRHVAHKQKGPVAPFPLLTEKVKLLRRDPAPWLWSNTKGNPCVVCEVWRGGSTSPTAASPGRDTKPPSLGPTPLG
jgi:hypothetical protein